MLKILVGTVTFLLLVVAPAAHAQVVNVSRTNKTIEVSLTESVRVDPEIAEIKLGYQNYGQTKDLAYEENVRKANQIVRAMLDARIPKEAIETEGVRLDRASVEELPAAQRKEREFTARQTWTIRVPVPEAQKVVDLAVNAGANLVEEVNWTVADPPALEAKANTAALAKARALAEQMARQLGANVGELLYVSNREPYYSRALFAGGGGGFAMTRLAAPPKPPLTLFPAKFERSATVNAVFALD